jgi:radical SAM protein with 4Fe4S-binding SPASM domain
MSYSRIRHVTVPGLRFHLRRGDPNMLWLNGQDLVMLNDTAAEFIEAFIEVMSRYRDSLDSGRFKKEIAERMRRRYPDVPEKTLVRDFDSIYSTLVEIAKGSCPIHDMELDTKETHPELWTAPPRMDLALTYRCNNNCSFCYTGGPRQVPELDTPSWKKIIDKLWDSGIPQIVFTGGEPTLRADLVELIENSQEFVTGLVTNGRALASLAAELNRVSLDYVQVSWESHLPEVHDKMVCVDGAWKETRDGILAALKLGMSVITNTTLTKDNLELFPEMIIAGAELGLKVMACNTLICSGRVTQNRKESEVSMEDLKRVLSRTVEVARDAGVKLEWYSPTCYRQLNPIEFGFGAKACSAAQYNMTVEPDGSVIPCQSWFKDRLGNLLTDPWTQIWEHPVAKGFRDKTYLKDRKECEGCEYLPQCYGGCPLEYSPSP